LGVEQIGSVLCHRFHIDFFVGWGRIDALETVQSLHQLELSKTASAASAKPGDIIIHTLTISTEHPSTPATHVVLTDTLPVGTSFFFTTQSYTQAGDMFSW
jgi:uncharacterized repeat protein (TIGR01451 family)